ncbi:MAG: hypothetical protein LBD89_03760 [Tannerellaceae bacterium]|jgi:hypothetical protein|nr:hypothetical protein [Tannerellaceae bacterium]
MKKSFFILIGCLLAANAPAQLLLGATAGIGAYQLDKSPVENSTKNTGGIFSEIVGLNLGVGNETVRLVVEGYEDYAPFTFSLRNFQGMGTFSAGAMGKLSFTFKDYWSDTAKGFSLGLGLEASRTELHFRKEDLRRDWYSTKYAYLAYSTYKETDFLGVQVDYFGKAGLGNSSVMRLEVGVRVSYYFFF